MKNLLLWLGNTLEPSFKNQFLLAAAIVIIPISGCNQQDVILEQGLLTGTITIGPLCPVETFPPDPNCQPTEATFKAWPIGVWTADKQTKLGQLEPAMDGSYNFELSEGTYLIDLEIQHLFGTTLPETIKIRPDETVILNIDIDTGIR
ncbi:MAG: hypothetical protein HKP42_11595 [Maribacter sp.]|nr:hypothetical protein [Maribacter sp.]NNK76689.1 hypothetical protein [Maribacter sp.]